MKRNTRMAMKMEDWITRRGAALALLCAALIYVPGVPAPPHLMDDTDAVQAEIPRNMLLSGDWVTPRLDGVPFLEKSPLDYWVVACSYEVFGIHDWAARLPFVISILLVCWLVCKMGRWAFGSDGGFYAGLSFSTGIGLFLFTRILIPDLMVTGTIAFSLWAMQRALDENERKPRLWSHLMGASMGVGLLLKGLISLLFPVAAGVLFLFLTGQLLKRRTWQRLRPFSNAGLILLVAAPWHILATLRNPPHLEFSMESKPGVYRGFFWYYFFNEHVLRFLNKRWPRDYNTVPRHLFWLFHLVWFFPWSAYLPGVAKLQYRGTDRASSLRLLCLCWLGFILVFFTFSTTQEYYSLPAYPAFALLLGSAMAESHVWVRWGARAVSAISALALAVIVFILASVWSLPTPGDISNALANHPEMYTLSMGHMGDLTLPSFAYLRPPLMMAGAAFLLGTLVAVKWRGRITQLGLAAMMVLFLNAARVAMMTFDPYLSSVKLAEAINRSPKGTLILGDQYYTFSSVFYYTGVERAWLLEGRYQNLEYGSWAPGAPNVFLSNAELPALWQSDERAYLVLAGPRVPEIKQRLGERALHLVLASGGKFLFTNHPI